MSRGEANGVRAKAVPLANARAGYQGTGDSLKHSVIALDVSITDNGEVLAVGILNIHALDGSSAHRGAGSTNAEIGDVEVEVTGVGEGDTDGTSEGAWVVV